METAMKSSRYLSFPGLVTLVLLLSANALRAQTLYITSGTDNIDEVDSSGNVTHFATVTGASSLAGLAFDGSGDLYVVDTTVVGQNVVRQISEVTPEGAVSTFVSLPGTDPIGLAFDVGGYLYAADLVNNQVLKITSGGTVSTFASLSSTDDPTGLAFDGGGNLYVSDLGTNQISKITPGGVVSTFASLPTSPSFSSPEGLVFGSNGDPYVAKGGSNQISQVTPGGVVSTFASLPGARPEGLTFGSNGDLYVADNGLGSISQITPDGSVTTLTTGVPGAGFIAEAPVSVPEPSGWALMLGGLGLLAVRRFRFSRA